MTERTETLSNASTVATDEPGLAVVMQRKLDEVQAELAAEKERSLAKDAKLNTFADAARSEIKEHQPEMKKFIEELQNDETNRPEWKSSLCSMQNWTGSVHESAVPDKEKDLVNFVVCCSQRVKRSLGDEEAANSLREVCSARDKLQEELDGSKRRCNELEELCLHNSTAKDVLVSQLQKSTHNFSNRTKREAGASAMETDSPNPMARDELTDWLRSTGSGRNEHTMKQGSTHSIYGADAPGSSSSSLTNIGEMISGRRGMM
jgi:hypothetical protein